MHELQAHSRWPAWLALAALYLAGVAQVNRADLDMWHEMALAREAWALGQLPVEDAYAYTPTVSPVVHHEWGTGVILYGLARLGGAGGVLTLRMLLAVVLAAVCVVCARRRGATSEVLCFLMPVGIFMTWMGFSPVRAQLFTMVMLAFLLLCLDQDRRGQRRWIVPWLCLYTLWLNLHGGFAISFPLLGLHMAEQALRRRPVGHLAATLLAMAGLIVVNPYGADYYPFLWRSLAMDRPQITEWLPIWKSWWLVQVFFWFSLVLLAYAVRHRGWRAVPGLPIVAVLAIEAMAHQRHAVLYAIAWTCYVPAWMQGSAQAEIFARLLNRRSPVAVALWGLIAAFGIGCAVSARPWKLSVPANPGDDPRLTYPAGAVDYLVDNGFRGNLMVPFTAGAYVLWKAHPQVKVSIDSRYEVAYQHGVFEEHARFYGARDGWEEVLRMYATDAVLVPRLARVAQHMPPPGWERAYRDDAFDVYVRDAVPLPVVDLSGQRLRGRFP